MWLDLPCARVRTTPGGLRIKSSRGAHRAHIGRAAAHSKARTNPRTASKVLAMQVDMALAEGLAEIEMSVVRIDLM